MSNPNLTAQQLVTKALRKLGVVNRRTPVDQEQMQDGLEALWDLLDSFNRQNFMIPFQTRYTIGLPELKRLYTFGVNGDLDFTPPLEIINAQWLSTEGNYYNIEISRNSNMFVKNNLARDVSTGLPTMLYWNPSYPVSQIEFNMTPIDGYSLILNVLLPWSAEICPCCSDVDCDTGCVSADCDSGNVDPDNYTITTTCAIGDTGCITEITADMAAYLEGLCDASCTTEYTQDFVYSGDAQTYTATATLTPRTSPLPVQLSLTQKTEFPAGYQSLIVWNLAEQIAPEYDIEPSSIIRQEAASSKQHIKSRNNRSQNLRVDSALLRGTRYNVWTGTTTRG